MCAGLEEAQESLTEEALSWLWSESEMTEEGSERSPGEGIGYPLQYSWDSFVAQLVKNPPAMQEIPV